MKQTERHIGMDVTAKIRVEMYVPATSDEEAEKYIENLAENKMSDLIEKIPVKTGQIITWIVLAFMCCNMAVSAMALARSTQRNQGIEAEYRWQEIMDERFDDARMERIYPNAVNVSEE